MNPFTPDLARSIERLKDDNDFLAVMEWITKSYQNKVTETIRMDIHNVQIGQGYSQALEDIMAKVNSSRETLDRSNKKRDTH